MSGRYARQSILPEVGAEGQARLAAATAVVVDDSDRATRWAADCGLRGVLVQRAEGEAFETAVLRAFDEVEWLIERA